MFCFGRQWSWSQEGLRGGGNLVREETCLEKFSTPNSGALFPITFNDCGAIFPILFLDIKFKICTLCWGVTTRVSCWAQSVIWMPLAVRGTMWT